MQEGERSEHLGLGILTIWRPDATCLHCVQRGGEQKLSQQILIFSFFFFSFLAGANRTWLWRSRLAASWLAASSCECRHRFCCNWSGCVRSEKARPSLSNQTNKQKTKEKNLGNQHRVALVVLIHVQRQLEGGKSTLEGWKGY